MSQKNQVVVSSTPLVEDQLQKEYLMLLVEETDRERIRFLDRFFKENAIPCHKKGAWLSTGASIKYYVPESYYLHLCGQLSIAPDPVLMERAHPTEDIHAEEMPLQSENAPIPKHKWLPLLIAAAVILGASALVFLFAR